MKHILSILLILIITISSCMKDPAGFSEDDGNNNGDVQIDYPSSMMPLSEAALQALRAEFNDLKGDGVSAELDEYGLVDFAGNLVRGDSDIADADTAVSKATEMLVKLGKFTNVDDSTFLEIKEATNEHGTGMFNDWVITFENQIYDGLEVLNTEVMVLVGDEVRQISGHHYANITVPETDAIGAEEAGQLLIGHEIVYVCWTPGTFIVSESSINFHRIEKVIYPLHLEDSIEFRVAWKIPVGANSSIPDWYVYMDVMLGEILLIEQTFIC